MKYKILIFSAVYFFYTQMLTAQCETYADSFEDPTELDAYVYSNNDGDLTWANSWTEINDDNDVLTGDVYFDAFASGVANHSLYIQNNAGIIRNADLSNCMSTQLNILVRGNTNSTLGDMLYFTISADGVNFDTIGSHDATNTYLNFYKVLPPSYNTSTFTIRLLSSGASYHRLQDVSLDCCPCIFYQRPESSLGAADGAISLGIHSDPGTSPMYSIDGGATWQLATTFDPLAAGTYTVLIRQPNVSGTYGPCEIEVGSVLVGDTRCPEPTTRGVDMTINNN